MINNLITAKKAREMVAKDIRSSGTYGWLLDVVNYTISQNAASGRCVATVDLTYLHTYRGLTKTMRLNDKLACQQLVLDLNANGFAAGLMAKSKGNLTKTTFLANKIPDYLKIMW